MREIKFRIWNKSHKKMNYFDSPSLKIDHDSGLHFKVKEEHIYLGGYADDIMQYTGINDCNGKEIYEGDIIKVFDGCKNKFNEEPSLVEFYYGAFNPRGYCVCDLSKCEIIGNIYENPELMEVEQ